MKEKTPMSHEVVCFQMLDFSVLKTTLLQREPFLTMFYTTNNDQQLPITHYQVRFYANNYFKNYQ